MSPQKSESMQHKSREKVSSANLVTWDKRRIAFLATNPRCSMCKEKILHYTIKKMCAKCRALFNKEKFNEKSPDYYKQYNMGGPKYKPKKKGRSNEIS